jgi:hypothetical protein
MVPGRGRLLNVAEIGEAEVANTQHMGIRVDPALLREAAVGAGLSPDAGPTQVIRLALAILAGKPNPHSVAVARPGPKPKAGAAA